MDRSRIQGLPTFLGTPYYLRHGYSYGLQIWWEYIYRANPNKSPLKFGEKGAWAYPEIVPVFCVPPIISGTR